MNQNSNPKPAKRGGRNITEGHRGMVTAASASAATATMTATLKQTVNATNFIVLLIAILTFIPSSEASFWQSPQKTVSVQNWDKTQISVRCFSFDDEHEVHHLKPQEEFSFTFRQSVIFPSSTMWNCSTSKGTFIAFKNDYDCNEKQINNCSWRFSLKEAYRYSPEYKKWIRYEYNPNYESLSRGGVVKGQH